MLKLRKYLLSSPSCSGHWILCRREEMFFTPIWMQERQITSMSRWIHRINQTNPLTVQLTFNDLLVLDCSTKRAPVLDLFGVTQRNAIRIHTPPSGNERRSAGSHDIAATAATAATTAVLRLTTALLVLHFFLFVIFSLLLLLLLAINLVHWFGDP